MSHLSCENRPSLLSFFFFFNDTATTEIYTLSLHDALPISSRGLTLNPVRRVRRTALRLARSLPKRLSRDDSDSSSSSKDRKSTRLNSSHQIISYAVFCLKKKKKNKRRTAARSLIYTDVFWS